MAFATPDLLNRSQRIEAPVVVDLSDTTARSTLLPAGMYELSASADCFVLQGGSGVNATTASTPVWSKTPYRLLVTGAADGYVAGIVSADTAKLYLTRLH